MIYVCLGSQQHLPSALRSIKPMGEGHSQNAIKSTLVVPPAAAGQRSHPSDNNKRWKFERCNQEPKGPKKSPKKKTSVPYYFSHTHTHTHTQKGVQKDTAFLPDSLTHSLTPVGFEKGRKSLILTHDKSQRQKEKHKAQKKADLIENLTLFFGFVWGARHNGKGKGKGKAKQRQRQRDWLRGG